MKLLLFISLFFTTTLLLGQLEVVHNNGHKLMISEAVFSADDSKIFTGGWDGKVKIWNAEYLKEISTLYGHKSHVNAIVEWTENDLFSAGVYELFKWNLTTKQSEKIPINLNVLNLHKLDDCLLIIGKNGIGILKNPTKSKYIKHVYNSSFEIKDSELLNDSTLLIASDKQLHILDLQTFKLIRNQSLPKIDRIQSINFDSKSELISCSGMNQSYLFSADSLKHLSTFNNLNNATVIINESLIGVKYGSTDIQEYSISSEKLIRDFEPSLTTPTKNLIVSNNAKFVLGYGYCNMTLWNNSGLKIHDFTRIKNPIHGINTNGHLVSCGIGSKGASRLFNLKTLEFEQEFHHHGSTVLSTLIKDDHIWLFGADQRAIKLDLDSYRLLESFNIDDPKEILPPISEKSAMDQLSLGLFGEHVHQAIETNIGDLIFQMNNDIKILKSNTDNYVILKGHNDYVKDIKLINDDKMLLSASLDKTIKVWNLQNHKCENTFDGHSDRVFALEILDDHHFLSGAANGDLFLWDIEESMGQKIDQLEGSVYCIQSFSDFIAVGCENGIVIYDKSSQKRIQTFDSNISAIKSIKAINDRLFLTEDKNDRLQIWSKSALIANFIFTQDGSIIYTPESYYFGTKKAIQKNVHFSDGTNMYLFDQFDLVYNRPDIIAKELGLADSGLIQILEKAHDKRKMRMGAKINITDLELNAPSIKWSNSTKVESSTKKSKVVLTYQASSKVEITHIHLLINDVPIFGSAGKKIKPAFDIESKQAVELMHGKNKIQIYVTDAKGVHSPKITKYIIKESQQFDPTTYLICIGASTYEQSEFDLNYAKKDAEDMLELFSQQIPNLKSKILTNQDVNKENVLEVSNFLKGAKIDDQVIIFYAGHGVLDAELNYYFATHDMDFTEPAKNGLAYEKVESLLDGIKPLRKLLLIDACHSGEFDKSEVELNESAVSEDGDVAFRSFKNLNSKINENYSAFELSKSLFADIRTGNGATVIASAGGLEFAIEGDSWKNGLFTYSILSGTQSGAADLNQDGEIWLSELQIFVSNRVFELSNGAQQPTSRIENQTIDFKLFSVR